MQSQASYHSASSSPSARCPSAGFDDVNEEANVHANATVVDGHANVRASAVMTNDNDDDADISTLDKTLSEILSIYFAEARCQQESAWVTNRVPSWTAAASLIALGLRTQLSRAHVGCAPSVTTKQGQSSWPKMTSAVETAWQRGWRRNTGHLHCKLTNIQLMLDAMNMPWNSFCLHL